MLPIRSDQYLLHTDEERAALMLARQERVNVLLDLGCSQETIDQADARVLEIDEANEKIAVAVQTIIHDEMILEFDDPADHTFATRQLLRRLMTGSQIFPRPWKEFKLDPKIPILTPPSASGRIASDMDRQFLEGAGAFRTPRALQPWAFAQVDYNALEIRTLMWAQSHSFDFGRKIDADPFDGAMVDADGAALAGIEE